MTKINQICLISLLSIFAISIYQPKATHAHCQVPCGIYDDKARVENIKEDVATIEKALNSIKDFSENKDIQSVQQSIRWVTNKEKHAENIIRTISDYFLTQRVKSNQKDYSTRLATHHAVIVNAMRVKQHTEIKYLTDYSFVQ